MAAKNEEKKELARLYYMQGESQKVIASRIGVSENTVGKWAQQGQWRERRAAVSVTRPEIVNRTLQVIGRLTDKLSNSDDLPITDVTRIVDQLVKLAATIQRIDKKANVVDAMEVFIAFNRWLEARMEYDKEITPELLRLFDHYQSMFVMQGLSQQKTGR